MSLFSYLIRAYITVLLFRWVLTQQELSFNYLGRAIAKITNPIFSAISNIKSESDRFIPILIILLGFINGTVHYLSTSGSFITALLATYVGIVTFISYFLIICVVLGSMATSELGTLPIFFFRIGNSWVKLVRRFVPIRGNLIIIPTIVTISLSCILINTGLNALLVSLLQMTNSLNVVAIASAAQFVYDFTGVLRLYSFILVARALMSWVSPSPQNLLVQTIYYVTEPLLYRIRSIIPSLGMVDVSVIVALLLVSGLNILIIGMLSYVKF